MTLTQQFLPAHDVVQAQQILERAAKELNLVLGVGSYLDLRVPPNVRLTAGAQLMLLIPVVEAAQIVSLGEGVGIEWPREVRRAFSVDRMEMVQTLTKLSQEMIRNPAAADKVVEEHSSFLNQPADEKSRTALSVVRAFWRKFCRIPPICGEPRPWPLR